MAGNPDQPHIQPTIARLVASRQFLPPCCNLSSLYVCMAKTIYLFSFVETPRKSIIAKLCEAFFIIRTDEDPSLRIESFAMINLRGVSTKLNEYFVATCQRVTTNLSISSCCHKSVKIRLFATCHLQTCYNLLKQLAASLWITSFENQLATSQLTTFNRLVVNKLSQAMRTHPDITLSLATCCKMSTGL